MSARRAIRRVPTTHPSAEHALLESLRPLLNFRPSARYPSGIGDDAVVRRCSAGERLVLTTDVLVQEVDFSLDYMTLTEVGFKSMAVNLSDCAAMGALPDSALVAVTFPAGCASLRHDMAALYRGINRACHRWSFPIVGGDLSAGPGWSIAVTLIGRLAPRQRALMRTGARAGDGLWVSGRPGVSAAGLAALRRWGRAGADRECRLLVQRHVKPEPRLSLGRQLGGIAHVHAMIDISDGVSKECCTLAHENRLGIKLHEEAFPLSDRLNSLARRLRCDATEWFLHGGEDFELLFAASPAFEPDALTLPPGVKLTKIGTFVHGKGVRVRGLDGSVTVLENRAWDHVGLL